MLYVLMPAQLCVWNKVIVLMFSVGNLALLKGPGAIISLKQLPTTEGRVNKKFFTFLSSSAYYMG